MTSLASGAVLPTLSVPPITPVQVAFMVVANNDTAAIHVDEAVARAAGLPRPVAPGSFVLGHLGRLLEQVVGFAAIRALEVRFRAPVFTGDALTVGGTVEEVRREGETTIAGLILWVRDAAGSTLATATARVVQS